ncbi:MAG: cobalt-precorrin-5B (C(1))-methyltransferase [Desulfobacteraceae bacterium]|nr:cobalt-precorrin-5B (C(1))-methyltransferase [Desulfobacteraceae bacterium]
MESKTHPKLRSGFTTGAAAAAAAKAAVIRLLENRTPDSVGIRFLTGDRTAIAIHDCAGLSSKTAVCRVIKDAGDDPDVTHKAIIGAKVSLREKSVVQITITGGQGVGRVTRPGLEVPPGEPAINTGPRKMIEEAVAQVLTRNRVACGVEVEVFVPEGEAIAAKTLNARLGILGGISILGTTGIVRPMSHDAYIATIRSALSVARASGNRQAILTTGRRSERFAQGHWPELDESAFIQIGDFFKMSLEGVSAHGFAGATLAVFFAKALKMAHKIPHTHAAKSALTLDRLAAWTAGITGSESLAEKVRHANTARHAFDLLRVDHPAVIARVGREMTTAAREFAGTIVNIRSVIFDYAGNIAFDSERTR